MGKFPWYEQDEQYQVLGISKGADESAIKKAYRELAKRCHPDLNPDDLEAEYQFKQVQRAYEAAMKNIEPSIDQDASQSPWHDQHPFESFYWAAKSYMAKKGS